ncbi:MAG: GNAT family N-acetyltransferase [Brooklawnia sp.]|jgi:ribosomal protein S18 acetylase RimI-like enzyme
MSWQVATKAGLLERSGGDPYVALDVAPDGLGLVGPLGWLATRVDPDGRAGVTAGLSVQPSAAESAELIAALNRLATANGFRVTWITAPDTIELALDERWQLGGHWVWMSAREVSPDDTGWPLVELDDHADAEELRAFALPINPIWEGDPGIGKNRYWLGARNGAGRLIGCGTVYETPAGIGHLAGLVVDPAHRNQGLGRALVIALSQRVLADDGATTLSAYAGNSSAISVYRRVGYQLNHRFRSRFLEPRR